MGEAIWPGWSVTDMQRWAHDLFTALGCSMNADAVFEVVEAAAKDLGFEWCAFGLRSPSSLTRPDFQLLNNYPAQWRMRYQEAGYLACDPTIKRGIRSQLPMMWDNELFADVPCLWDEAQAMGLRVGWAQSRFDGTGAGSLLTLARSGEVLGRKELESKALQLNWLVSSTHEAFTCVLTVAHSAVRCAEGEIRRDAGGLRQFADSGELIDAASRPVQGLLGQYIGSL